MTQLDVIIAHLKHVVTLDNDAMRTELGFFIRDLEREKQRITAKIK